MEGCGKVTESQTRPYRPSPCVVATSGWGTNRILPSLKSKYTYASGQQFSLPGLQQPVKHRLSNDELVYPSKGHLAKWFEALIGTNRLYNLHITLDNYRYQPIWRMVTLDPILDVDCPLSFVIDVYMGLECVYATDLKSRKCM